MRVMLKSFGLVAICMLLSACSKEKIGEFADKAKQAVAEGADQVKEKAGAVTNTAKEQLALAGSCELKLDAPVTASACYFAFLPQGSGRSNVLQLRSYRDPNLESFPSVMLQSQVKAGGVSELVGQTVQAQMFVQTAANAPVWFCAPGALVDLKIISSDDKQLVAEIVGGNLQNSQTGSSQTVTGKLNGIPQ